MQTAAAGDVAVLHCGQSVDSSLCHERFRVELDSSSVSRKMTLVNGDLQEGVLFSQQLQLGELGEKRNAT